MPKFLVRHRATVDMDGIADYIADSNPKMAIAFYDEAQTIFKLLGDAPELGSKIDLIPPLEIRMFPMGKFKSYLVFYIVEKGMPNIIRVIHGRRDIEALFDDDMTLSD
jgi:toxin ParE1/3/4